MTPSSRNDLLEVLTKEQAVRPRWLQVSFPSKIGWKLYPEEIQLLAMQS
jgi:hypothetical protein